MVYRASCHNTGRASFASGCRLVGGLIVLCCVALAQYPGQYPPGSYPPGGTYPPGQYPPGTYPPGSGRGGPGIPLPSKKTKTKEEATAPLPNFRGKLTQMDDKTLTLELEDHRELQFKRNGKTKFFKNGDEVKSPKFDMGDQLSVEGPLDPEGFMTAVNVYWEKSGHATDSASSGSTKDTREGVDAWKDDPKDGKKDDAAPPRATEIAPPPAPADPDDPGRPKLVRGRASDPSREHASTATPDPVPPPAQASAPVTVADARPGRPRPADDSSSRETRPAVARNSDDDAPVRRNVDPLINKAIEAALDFTEGLPDYVCQEMMARYQSLVRPANWQALDVVSMAVVYEHGKEDYRNITVNGKALKSGETKAEGAWSTGEFGTMLIDLFSPATDAKFRPRGSDRTGGVMAKLYDYDVKRENSHWTITMGSQSYRPPYKGSIWIDPATSRVLRIEMQAFGFPDDFPTDHVESAMDYQYTRLGDAKQYLLPVHAETLSCQRGSDFCSHNVIDFRNYHKYTGESSITFAPIK